MLGTAAEVSGILAAVEVILTLVIIPSVVNRKTYMPRLSSGLTMAGLFITTGCFFDLGLYTAGLATLFGGMIWLSLFVLRGSPPVFPYQFEYVNRAGSSSPVT
jgi:hypothetical protein